jgi:hypothetical protein
VLNNLKNNIIVLVSVLVTSGVFPLLSSSSSSSLTTNPEDMIESNVDNNAKNNDEVNSLDIDDKPKRCGDSFLSRSEGGSIPQEFLDELNTYLAQHPVAIGDEPLTDVKNIVGLCNLINLIETETENTEERQANGEQIRNILKAAWPDKSNPLVIDTIIDSLVGLNLIEPSDD